MAARLIPKKREGETPLMTAAMKGRVHTVRSLLDKPGIHIDAKTADGVTALNFACRGGHLEVVKLLVAAGARVNPKAKNEWASLVSAASGGHLQVVSYLVEAGADVRRAGPDGKTSLMVAVEKGRVRIVEYLLGRPDINIDAKTPEGFGALDFACCHGHLELVKLLVGAGARVDPQARNQWLAWAPWANRQASDDWGALSSAALGGHLQVVEYLVREAGANKGCVGRGGQTPLVVAVEKCRVQIVKFLLDGPHIDVNARTAEGRGALDFACRAGNLEMVKLLVAAGARVNPQDSKEWGALSSAAYGGHLQVVKYLVDEAGADDRCVDRDGNTPRMVAADKGHVDIEEYLRTIEVSLLGLYRHTPSVSI
jgi:ankyrin repeat protein